MITVEKSRRYVEISGDRADDVYAVPRALGATLNPARSLHAGRYYVEAAPIGGIPLIRVAESRALNPLERINPVEFRADAIRTLTAQYYRRETHEPPPGFFRGNRQFNAALNGYIQGRVTEPCSLRVKEIGAGSYRHRWGKRINVDNSNCLSLEVTVSDCTLESSEPRRVAKNVTLRTRTEDLYSPIQSLDSHERYHVVLGTYLLDSLSFPGDKMLRKIEGTWYEILLRPLEPEIFSDVEGERQRLGYEWITVPVRLANEEVHILNKCFSEDTTRFVHFPKGIIGFLREIVRRQVANGGALLFGDIGALNESCSSSFPISFTSGGAPFVHMQMPLLIALAKTQGFAAELQSIDQFVARYAADADSSQFDRQVFNEARANHGVMLFRLP